MKIFRKRERLTSDQSGSVVVEFAIAGPVFIALLIGLFQVAVQVQNYNALRSLSSDVARYVVVEYQKDNKLDTSQIEARTAVTAVSAPYLLDSTQLDIDVTTPTSTVMGTKKFDITLGYALPNWLTFFNVANGTISYSRQVFVPG